MAQRNSKYCFEDEYPETIRNEDSVDKNHGYDPYCICMSCAARRDMKTPTEIMQERGDA